MEQPLPGNMDLKQLLKNISPDLQDGEYVFCTLEGSKYGDYAEYKPIASFVETEGLTLVLLKDAADNSGLQYEGVFRCITLNVHSSLQAVGFVATISTALSEHGISANVFAGYFHDHVFVQAEFANQALGILLELSR